MIKKKSLLNPNSLKIDNRSMPELINYANRISKELVLYNHDNQPNSLLYEMFSRDDTFLISEIIMFDVTALKSSQIKYIKKHDREKETRKCLDNLIDYLDFNFVLFETMNDWFYRSMDIDMDINQNDLNSSIEVAIKSHASELYQDYQNIVDAINVKLVKTSSKISKKFERNFSIWKTSEGKINLEVDLNKLNNKSSKIDFLFKKLILINNNQFKLINSIIKIASTQLDFSLKNDDHKPHIGLLLSFLNLFQNLQKDINQYSEKHLDFYYKKILGQKQLTTAPNKTYAVIGIDQNLDKVELLKNEKINAGQYSDGSLIKYKLDNDVELNNAKLSFLMTIYLGINEQIDFRSRYNLIDSIYSKNICNDSSEFEKFNKSDSVFNALGKDQSFVASSERTMDHAEIGFILGSSSLKLGKSRRKILIEFFIDESSFRHLIDLLVDISNNNQTNEEDVFHQVFSDSLNLFYSAESGWDQIKNYEFLLPDDWSQNKLTLSINLSKSDQALFDFDKETHGYDIEAKTPLIKILVNQNKFYNSYAFLNTIILKKVRIKSELYDLKDIKIFVDGQNIPKSNEFNMFGQIPKQNSKFFIGCEQIFNKNISRFQVNWHYSNLNEIGNNLSDYYKNYGVDFSSEHFKLKFSLLSDFNYKNVDQANSDIQMFHKKDNILSSSNSYSASSIDKFGVLPNYKNPNEYLKDFSNDYETGLIKVELDCPSYCFGHRIYPKVYASNVTKSISKKGVDISDNFINEPFSPKIDQISIDYTSESELYFDENSRSENNFDENNSFFHISPYGVNSTFSKNYIGNNLFFNLSNQGELIIGLECNTNIKNLDLFFEITKNENDNYIFSPSINWFYRSWDTWKPLTNQNLLSEQTNNLLNSGVISFIFPDDFNSNGRSLRKNTFFLKASSKKRADQFGLIRSIHTNSVSVTEVIPDDESLRLDQLRANSFQNFENNIRGVISVAQPIDSPKITLSENKLEYYNRVSHLLKHKNRPITKSDYEDFLLHNFDYLSYVKCISDDSSTLSLVCLKKIQSTQHIDEVKLSSSEILEITDFLKKYISPHIEIKITNPIFEDMWVKCSIKFKQLNPGRAIEQLNKDLLTFVCPWKNNTSIDFIPDKISNIDILNYIKDRTYIDYITGFSVVHLKKDESGSVIIYDSAKENYDNDFIVSGSSTSLIVPRNRHLIKIIDRTEYEEPVPINLNDLIIEDNFVTETRAADIPVANKRKIDEDNYDNLQFTLN